MSKWDKEDNFELESVSKDKYKITVEFIVIAESIDDAQDDIKSIIEEGVVVLIDNEEREPVHSWDIVDAEQSELV